VREEALGMDWNKKQSRGMFIVGAAAALFLAMLFLSCGTSKTVQATQRGPLYTLMSDAPLGDVLTFRVGFSGMSLGVADSTTRKVTLFPTASLAPNTRLNFASLRDVPHIFYLTSVPVLSYDRAYFTVSLTQMVVYDPSLSPPVRNVTVKLHTSTAPVPIAPDLKVTKTDVHVLKVDFDMVRSIAVDDQGQVTGDVTPYLTVMELTSDSADGFGYFDDLLGFVSTVTPSAIGQAFTGAIAVQTLSGTGPLVTVYLNGQTELYGVPDLASLETGRIVEVGAYMDSSGNVVARNIEVEDRASIADRQIAFVGVVLPDPVKDSDGNVAQLQLFVRQEEPDRSSAVPLDGVVTVNVLPTTVFQVSSRASNFANIPFNAAAIAAGQELIVHGEYSTYSNQPTVVAPTSIYLKLQTMQGKMQSLVQVGSDNKTGAFWLTPDGKILQGAPLLVLTTQETNYVSVLGLGQITALSPLLVRGLPFYQATATTINGISVPAGTMVVEARQVHVLQ